MGDLDSVDRDDLIDDEQETTFVSVVRGYLGESIAERHGKFWVITPSGDFGPYDSFEEALGEPVDGPVNVLTCDVKEVNSNLLTTERLLEIFWVWEPEDTPYTVQINGEPFVVRGEKITRLPPIKGAGGGT